MRGWQKTGIAELDGRQERRQRQGSYLFPPYDIPLDIRGRILHETANFYRWVIGYQCERVPLDRTVTVHDPSGSESSTDSENDRDAAGIG